VHDGHRLTLLPYLERWAGAFRSRIEMLSYDELFRSAKLARCTHVFTDLERLHAEDRERAARVWKSLEEGAPEVRLLNHPLLAMRRYELLRTLREHGHNDFDVYRLTEARTPKRFPVFLRSENDHLGPESGLIPAKDELERAVAALSRDGKSRDARIAVEFCAEAGADGWFRKYAAFYVDGAVVPRHIMFARSWVVKAGTKVVDDGKSDEERRWAEANPHADWIGAVFRLARIDYGRIDYGIVAGRPQAYEINTNPTIFPAEVRERSPRNERFAAAITEVFAELDARTAAPGPRGWVTMAPPLHGRFARLAGKVLGRLFHRQLRTPI
jgi:hypothetical protein